MDAWRGKDAPVLQGGKASGGLFAKTSPTGREDRPATFPPDAMNWPKMPRIARAGRQGELANCLSN